VELGLCLVGSKDGWVLEGNHFCGGFLVALGYSLHFPHQPLLQNVDTVTHFGNTFIIVLQRKLLVTQNYMLQVKLVTHTLVL
jgi:hypothetical protein